MNAIDDYLAGQPEPQRSTLAALRSTIAALLPRAEESIAYGAPAWKVDGTAVAGFAGFAKHCAYLPFSGAVTETLAEEYNDDPAHPITGEPGSRLEDAAWLTHAELVRRVEKRPHCEVAALYATGAA